MRKRIQHWLWDGQYKLANWLEDRGRFALAARLTTIQEWLIEEPGKRLLCRLFGHDPIADQCGRAEHDFCVWCNASTPGMAPRAVK